MQEYDNDYYKERKHLYADLDKADDELEKKYNNSTSSKDAPKKSSRSAILSEILSYIKIQLADGISNINSEVLTFIITQQLSEKNGSGE